VRNKLLQTKNILKEVFIHDEYYIDAVLAAFASRSHICLLGYRGSGKTHLMESLLMTVDDDIKAISQGYLSAELEDIFARPDIAKLIQGKEEVVFKKMVLSRVKAFDEIQRLGPSALSTLFRLLTTGTVIYLDREEGVRPYWVIATANPTEDVNDQLNIGIPEPLWDRFDAVMWVPIPKLTHLIKINGKIEELKEGIPVIWRESDLLQLWSECKNVKMPEELEFMMTAMIRMMGFCRHAQSYDASSLAEAMKRELCSKCNKSYICSRILRPPSVRAKMAWIRLARGFAYLRGHDEVQLVDVQDAFPLVFWKRVKFMDNDQISNPLIALMTLFDALKREFIEAKEAIDLYSRLRERYDRGSHERLAMFANTKPWVAELVDDLGMYLADLFNTLKDRFIEAKKRSDYKTMINIIKLAKAKLPEGDVEELEELFKVEVTLNLDVLARIAEIDKKVFDDARRKYDLGETKYVLKGMAAIKYMAPNGRADP